MSDRPRPQHEFSNSLLLRDTLLGTFPTGAFSYLAGAANKLANYYLQRRTSQDIPERSTRAMELAEFLSQVGASKAGLETFIGLTHIKGVPDKRLYVNSQWELHPTGRYHVREDLEITLESKESAIPERREQGFQAWPHREVRLSLIYPLSRGTGVGIRQALTGLFICEKQGIVKVYGLTGSRNKVRWKEDAIDLGEMPKGMFDQLYEYVEGTYRSLAQLPAHRGRTLPREIPS